MVQSLISRLFSYLSPSAQKEVAYFLRGGFWLMLGYVAQVSLGIALAAALANLLPKDIYGAYQFVLSMAAVVSVFTLTGMGSAIARAAAQGSHGALRYGTRKQLQWSAAVAFLSLALAAYYAYKGNQQLVAPFLLLACTQPFVLGFGLYRTFLYGAQRFRQSVRIDMLQRALPSLALIGTLFVTQDLTVIIAVFFISQAISLAGGYLYVVWKYRLPSTPDRELYQYSKHLSVMESLNEIAAVADKVLVWVFLGAAPLAAYALAQLPVIHLQTILGFGRTLAFPRFASAPFSEVRARIPKAIRTFFLLSLAVVVGYVALAPIFFSLLFPKYPEAVAYSQVLAFAALSIPRSLISEAFRAHGFTRELYYINITAPLTRIALLFLGLYLYGIWGAIAGILCAEAFSAIFQWTLFKHLSPLR